MRKPIALLLGACLALSSAAAADIKISGSTTVFLSLVKVNKEAVSAETQCNITVAAATTGKGFNALLSGQADIAMSTENLAGTIDLVAKSGKAVNPDDFIELPLKPTYLVFVCHKSNPISTLTQDQIHDILTGKITSWKDVGGADQPIAIFSEREESGNNALVKKHVLKGDPLTVRGITYVDNSRLIVRNIAEVETSFGPSSDLYVDDAVKVIKGYNIEQHLCFIIRKNAAPEVRKVVDAFLAKQK